MEKMSSITLGRAYRMEIHQVEGVSNQYWFKIFPSVSSGRLNNIFVQRVGERDFSRVFLALRAKYKIPLLNINFVDFTDTELAASVGLQHVLEK
jgi:hypothetical protein